MKHLDIMAMLTDLIGSNPLLKIMLIAGLVLGSILIMYERN
jgi:hypothetical protein